MFTGRQVKFLLSWAVQAFWRYPPTAPRQHERLARTKAVKCRWCWAEPTWLLKSNRAASPLYWEHAPSPSFHVECDPRTPFCAVAQSLSSLPYGNLRWTQDGQNRVPGILGIHVPRTPPIDTLPQMDSGDVKLRPCQADKSVSFLRPRLCAHCRVNCSTS